MTSMSNAAVFKQSLRKLIQDLLTQVPVPPTTTTAGKARAWFGGSSGLQPTAVNVWIRQSLTENSLYTGSPVTLTAANALAYCENVDERVDEFVAGERPDDPILGQAYDWAIDSQALTIDESFIEWFSGSMVASIIVEI